MKWYLKVVHDETGTEQNYEFNSMDTLKEKIDELNSELSEEYMFYIANDETLKRK